MDRVKDLYGELDKCMRVIDSLRETIYWYAEPHGRSSCIAPCCIDNGRRARAAIDLRLVEGWDGNGSSVVEIVRKGVEL